MNSDNIMNHIKHKCKKSGINMPDAFIVVAGDNEVIHNLAESFDNAKVINPNPIYTEYVCNSDEGCVVLKSVGNNTDSNIIRMYISNDTKSTASKIDIYNI